MRRLVDMSGNESEKSSKSKSIKRGPSPILYIPRLIPLVIKLGFVYLGFKRKAKKAGKIFKKELIAGGLDKNFANELTKEYLKTSHFLKGFDFSDMVRSKH